MFRSTFLRWFLIGIATGVTIYRSFWNLGTTPIERWDEQTNIAVLNDSVSVHRLPVLYLGNQPFFEKPPLWYITNILTAQIIGTSPASMRLISALSGASVIFLTSYCAYIWWGTVAGFTTWITLITTHHFFVTNPAGIFSTHTMRSADADSMYIFLLVSACIACIHIFTNKKIDRWIILAGILSGLAALTKSLFGLTPLLLTSYYLHARKKNATRYIFSLWRISFLVMLPWHIFMVYRFGYSFLYSYGIYHILARTLVPIEGHDKPLWYYVSLISNPSLFPGFVLLLFSSGILVYQKKMITDFRLKICFGMMLLSIIVPTIVQTKLAWYILPFYPFAALVTGAGIQCGTTMLAKRRHRYFFVRKN
jgi:4-amino-4-deoxy-L-arabinose transferase-like glycosyltransferase